MIFEPSVLNYVIPESHPKEPRQRHILISGFLVDVIHSLADVIAELTLVGGRSTAHQTLTSIISGLTGQWECRDECYAVFDVHADQQPLLLDYGPVDIRVIPLV